MEVETKGGWIHAVRQLAGAIVEGDDVDVTSESISDASAIGKQVLTADTAANARSAIGAGTSNLVVGTTASTAKAGNYTPTTQEVSSALSAKAQIAALTDLGEDAELSDVIVSVNAIIAALKA